MVSTHFPPADLDRLAEGRLALDEKRRLLAHLLKRCPQCCEALGSRVLPPLGAVIPIAQDEDRAYDVAVGKAITRSLRSTASHREAMAILAALLAGDRVVSHPEPLLLAKLEGLARIQALVEAGRTLRYDDPRQMLAFMKLAHGSANRLRMRDLGRETVADFRALVCAELANAYRVCDELDQASRVIARAIYWCHRGSGTELLLARVTDLLASLCAYQRRFAEGQKLLGVVYRAHVKARRWHLAGRALIKQGHHASWAGSPRTALRRMLQGFELLDSERDPYLAVDTLWAMLWTLADLGHFRRVRRLLWRSRPLLAEVIEPHRIRWLEARIYEGLSNWARAEPAYQQARAGFAERDRVYPAALVGLDLAALWARQHRVREVHDLAEEIIVTFRALRIAREAITTLVILKRACVQGSYLLGAIDMASNLLRELERQPAKPRR